MPPGIGREYNIQPVPGSAGDGTAWHLTWGFTRWQVLGSNQRRLSRRFTGNTRSTSETSPTCDDRRNCSSIWLVQPPLNHEHPLRTVLSRTPPDSNKTSPAASTPISAGSRRSRAGLREYCRQPLRCVPPCSAQRATMSTPPGYVLGARWPASRASHRRVPSCSPKRTPIQDVATDWATARCYSASDASAVRSQKEGFAATSAANPFDLGADRVDRQGQLVPSRCDGPRSCVGSVRWLPPPGFLPPVRPRCWRSRPHKVI